MPASVLDLLLNYGPLALALVLFLGALGLPIPSTALVLAAGALAREGLVEVPALAVLAASAALLGDAASYLLARRGLAPFLGRLEKAPSWHRAEQAFERWGKLAVLSSRFLVTPLSLPVNVIAGGVRYPFGAFVLLCAMGEILWVTLFGGLGYLFAGSWREIWSVAGTIGSVLAASTVVAVISYEAYNRWRHRYIKPGG